MLEFNCLKRSGLDLMLLLFKWWFYSTLLVLLVKPVMLPGSVEKGYWCIKINLHWYLNFVSLFLKEHCSNGRFLDGWNAYILLRLSLWSQKINFSNNCERFLAVLLIIHERGACARVAFSSEGSMQTAIVRVKQKLVQCFLLRALHFSQ